MTLSAASMKPKSMVVVKQEVARSSVLVNNLSSVAQRSVIANASDLMRCKRKVAFVPGQNYPVQQPASVARRNARERNRVKQVNNGFATLRSHIPPAVAAALTTEKPSSRSSSANKKLSKVETLKMAVEYIRSLQQMLDEHNGTIEKKSEGYDLEEAYYSSSPETIVSGETQYYPNSPEGYAKSEPLDTEFYSAGRQFVKSENYPNFNPEIHETLTSEFYHARSPVKAYSSPERDVTEDGLTALTAAMPPSHAFMPPRSHPRSSTSLSPPMSDACPSPTPSYSSDHSSLHPASVVSSSSGHLAQQLSRLTTVSVQQSTESRRGSPEGYDSYEAMSPEDEELLDAIWGWQQSN